MKLQFSPNFIKQVEKLPSNVQLHTDTILHVLSGDPFYPTLHTKRLKGEYSGLFSCRVTREYRVIFKINDNGTIRLIEIAHRKDIYR